MKKCKNLKKNQKSKIMLNLLIYYKISHKFVYDQQAKQLQIEKPKLLLTLIQNSKSTSKFIVKNWVDQVYNRYKIMLYFFYYSFNLMQFEYNIKVRD